MFQTAHRVSTTSGAEHMKIAVAQKPQDLLDVMFTPDLLVAQPDSTGQAVAANVTKPIAADGFWDAFETIPITSSKTTGNVTSVESDALASLFDEFACSSSNTSSKVSPNNNTSTWRAKEVFDDLDDFWASA